MQLTAPELWAKLEQLKKNNTLQGGDVGSWFGPPPSSFALLPDKWFLQVTLLKACFHALTSVPDFSLLLLFLLLHSLSMLAPNGTGIPPEGVHRLVLQKLAQPAAQLSWLPHFFLTLSTLQKMQVLNVPPEQLMSLLLLFLLHAQLLFFLDFLTITCPVSYTHLTLPTKLEV